MLRVEAIFCWSYGGDSGGWDVDTVDLDLPEDTRDNCAIHTALNEWASMMAQSDPDDTCWEELVYIGLFSIPSEWGGDIADVDPEDFR